jgi:hypothetical protein
MVARVARGAYEGDYRLEPASGEYVPAGYAERLGDYFLLAP